MKKEIREAKTKYEEAYEHFKTVRSECNHPKGRLLWKAKAGRYFCDDCEQFLPRNYKP